MASEDPTLPATTPTKKCCGTLLAYVEKNPVAAVVQALAVGFAVGLVIRLVEGTRDKDPEIDVKHKPTIDDAKFHLGSLVLPFLWPAWQKAQEGYGKSTKTAQDVARQIKTGKLTKEGKERLKEVEAWAEREAELLAELAKKGSKGVEAWVEKEGERLTELGKKKAKDVEEWVEKEILPAAECGWKKLRMLFR
jgi:hypothetical protein